MLSYPVDYMPISTKTTRSFSNALKRLSKSATTPPIYRLMVFARSSLAPYCWPHAADAMRTLMFIACLGWPVGFSPKRRRLAADGDTSITTFNIFMLFSGA